MKRIIPLFLFAFTIAISIAIGYATNIHALPTQSKIIQLVQRRVIVIPTVQEQSTTQVLNQLNKETHHIIADKLDRMNYGESTGPIRTSYYDGTWIVITLYYDGTYSLRWAGTDEVSSKDICWGGRANDPTCY